MGLDVETSMSEKVPGSLEVVFFRGLAFVKVVNEWLFCLGCHCW